MTLGMTPDKRKIAPPPPNTHYSSAGLSYALTVLVLSIPVSLICYITTCYLTTFPGTRATTLADTLRDSVWLFFHTVYRHPFHALWIFLLLLFTAILIWLAVREIRQRSDTRTFSSFVLSVAFLVPISVCFFYIFSFPTVRPKPILTASIDTLASEPVSEPTLTLITAEHHHALEEIKLRIEHDDDWFHIKFLLIGGLFTIFGTLLVLERIEIGRWRKEHASATSNLTQLGFEEMLGNPIASTIFAVAFIVAVIIDMHVRTSYMVVHQLANWILTHVDPILNCRKSIFSSYCETTPYLPWEGFLRLSDHGVKGMHEDFLWNLFQTPHFHFTTWVLYISYLLMFFWLYTYGSIGGSSDGRFGKLATTILLLAIAHVVLGIFAFLGHTAPGAFDEKVLAPGVELWISSDKAGSMFVIVWLVMTGLAALRVSSMIPGRQQRYAMLSSKWDLLPFRRWLLRRQCKRGGAPAADSHGPARRLLIVVTDVGRYLVITYTLIVIALSVGVFMNIHHMPDADEERVPRKERQGLGYVIVNKMRDCFSASEEHGLKLAVVLEAPKEYLALLKEYNVVEQVQGRLINEKANVQYKYQKPLYEYHAAEVEKKCGWDGASTLKSLDEFRYNENVWYSKQLETEFRDVICQYAVCEQDESAGLDPRRPKINKNIINVYFEKAGYDEEEQYELPEFVVADLNEGGRRRLKVKFIVVASAVDMGHIKKKEAEVVDGVLELLHNQKPEEVTKRDELRCNVRNRIITAITGKSNPDVCNGSREVSLNQMVKKVLIKELVVYEPPVVYEPVLSE